MSPRHSRQPGAWWWLSPALCLCAATSATAQFAPPQNVNLGVGLVPNSFTGIATGDLDSDGFGDILGVDDAIAGNIGVARGLVGGVYSAPILSGALPASTNGAFLPALGDFNADGFLDVGLAADVAGQPTVFVAAGDPAIPGGFVLPALSVGLGGTGTITSLRITDVNGDPNQDIICAVIGPTRRIVTMPGGGGLTFGPLISTATTSGVTEIDVCVDLGDDSDKDIVACGFMTGGQPVVEVLVGNDTGAFAPITPPVPLPPGSDPVDVHWLDCNQNKSYDLVVASAGTPSGLFRLINIGVPPFFVNVVNPVPFPVTNVPNSVLRLEANFDGVEDLSVFSVQQTGASIAATDFEVLNVLNCQFVSAGATASGSIAQNTLVKAAYSFHGVQDQDFDGREDVLIADQAGGQGRVRVHRNIAPTDFTVSPSEPLLGETTPFTFRLDAPPALGGAPLVVLFTVNGTLPGMSLQGLHLPLNPPFLGIFLPGTVAPGGNTTLVTPPLTLPKSPVGFSLQIACAAIVGSTTAPGKVGYISRAAVITAP